MGKFKYTGTEAFEEDKGTMWPSNSTQTPFKIDSASFKDARTIVRESASQKPIVWYVDDEKANREWFVMQHRQYFCVLTFSSKKYFISAFNNKIPCHTVVTDIFFPAKEVSTEDEANELLSIYDEIGDSSVKELQTVWQSHKKLWVLDGFSVAKKLAHLKHPIPVFLFSRKAIFLLDLTEFLSEPPTAVRNSHWLMEKVDPTTSEEISRKAADMQRERIVSALNYRFPFRHRFLSSLKIHFFWPPGATVDLRKLLN